MKKAFVSLLAAAVVLLQAADASAYIGLCCGKCGGNMPLNILGGGVPETNEFRFKVGPMFMRMDGLRDGTDRLDADDLLGMPVMMGMPTGRYMAVPTGMDMTMVNMAAGFSFTDDFFGGIMFMWRRNDMDMEFNSMMKSMTGKDGFTMESEGMADTMVMAKYRLHADDPLVPTSQVSLLLGLSLPTGSINELNRTHPVATRRAELLPYSMQLGSGTFDPKVGILYQGSSSPLWWGANLIYTARFYDNSRDWRLGDELTLDLYAMYQLRYDLVAQLQLGGRSWGGIRGEMDSVASGASGRATQGDPTSPYATPLYDPDNYGGNKVSVTAGLQWQPFPLQIVEIDFGVPVYQDLNGPQMEEDYRVMFTWYLELPTPSSIRYMGGERQGAARLGF
ncbi:MAG TPA: transporter [Deltaproteobacteria bacterium]|nr:transporter [Deltaproteobacteria bacterium]